MKILRMLIILAVLLSFGIPVVISYKAMLCTGMDRFIYLAIAFASCICPFLLGMTVREDWNTKEMEERRMRIMESQKWLSKMGVSDDTI